MTFIDLLQMYYLYAYVFSIYFTQSNYCLHDKYFLLTRAFTTSVAMLSFPY